MNKKFYPTFAEAQQAMALLNINSGSEYLKRYKEDPQLPSDPRKTYASEWPTKNGLAIFLGKTLRNFYPTLAEAQKAAILLGISSNPEYLKRYKEDPRLPSNPKSTYAKDWPIKNGWAIFLGNQIKDLYPTLAEAQLATLLLGIRTESEYVRRHKEDPRLPSNPRKTYASEWQTLNGRFIALGKTLKNFYPTLTEAQKAIALLDIRSYSEYKKRYQEDLRLPSDLRKTYASEWPTKNAKSVFLGSDFKGFYPTLAEAQLATLLLGISTESEYKRRYKEDPRLPSNPKKTYAGEWPKRNGRFIVLSKPMKNFYPTLAEAQQATALLGISSYSEYRKRYKEDIRLPAHPEQFYSNEWLTKNKGSFYSGKELKEYYPTLFEAKKATLYLGISSYSEYRERYKEDPRLPADPKNFYPEDWKKLSFPIDFYIPNKISSYTLLAQAVKTLDIKNSTQYRTLRKTYSQLPSNPKRSFPKEFIDWYHLCDIPKPYSYINLQRLVKSKKITTITKYNKWRISSKDPRIPSSPHESSFYKSDWVNWYVFFGTEEPFQPKYIHKPYLAWRDEINDFMRFAKGAGTKKTNLCKFVRLYVQKYQLGITPIDFVMNKNINIIKFKEFITQEISQATVYFAADEFIDYIIRTKCSDEDPDTGEIIRMPDAKNRIKGIWLPDGPSRSTPDETVKPALSYQYVQALRNWTTPTKAKTFSDLEHLHIFDADWVKVPLNVIDKNDPDCVFEIIDDKFAKLWVPIHWMHVYTLFSVPLRGIQIAYNDSGEADEYIPEYRKDKK